jgi:hypothetical protein
MTTSDPAGTLPANPNITHLKHQAKDLKRAVVAREPVALERVRKSHPSGATATMEDPAGFTLRDAQVVIAREYGFEGWHQLSTHVGEQMVEQRDLHRWFGVQLNNAMWEAIEDEDLGAHSPTLEKERLLYSAYASAYHWRNVGNAANIARGEHLISRMAARLGEIDLAVRHARRCLELIEAHPEVMEDWDLPFAHEALARALAGSGDLRGARAHFETAVELTADVSGDADRAIIEGELDRGPWFGLLEQSGRI